MAETSIKIVEKLLKLTLYREFSWKQAEICKKIKCWKTGENSRSSWKKLKKA